MTEDKIKREYDLLLKNDFTLKMNEVVEGIFTFRNTTIKGV